MVKKINKVVSLRKWKACWGLFVDQQILIQSILDEYNKDGWSVVQFDWTDDKWNIFRFVFVTLITFVTIGFFSYWFGASIIFEKEVE